MGLGNRLEELDAMLDLIERTHDKILVLLEHTTTLSVYYSDTQMFLYNQTPSGRDLICEVGYSNQAPVDDTLEDIEGMLAVAQWYNKLREDN